MEQIAAAADVAKGTLYSYFPSKEALLSQRFHTDLAAAMPTILAKLEALPDCVVRLRAFLHGTTAYAERHRELMAPLLCYRLSQPVDMQDSDNLSGIDLIYSRLLGEGQTSGEIRPDLPLGQLVNTLGFMHLCTILRWLHTPEASQAAEFDAILVLFLDGARAERNPTAV